MIPVWKIGMVLEGMALGYGKSVGSALCLFSVRIFNAVTLSSHSNNKTGKIKYIFFVEKIGNWLYNYVFRLHFIDLCCLPQLVS